MITKTPAQKVWQRDSDSKQVATIGRRQRALRWLRRLVSDTRGIEIFELALMVAFALAAAALVWKFVYPRIEQSLQREGNEIQQETTPTGK